MSMFSIGVGGLSAAQNALNTTSNNISNVYTPGYNRELVILGEARGDGGVRVNDIQRQFDQFVAGQLNQSTSTSKGLEAYQMQINQIDNLLADDEAGLAPIMQKFFSAVQDLANSPSDPAARQGFLGAADILSSQFRSFDGFINDMQRGINGQVRDEVTQINALSEQLAALNKDISLARARTGDAPLSLLNQRDHLITELSEHLDLQLNIQDGKSYNVSLPNGQPLVTGANAFRLEPVTAPNDPQRIVPGYRDGSGTLTALPENMIQGGTLGGLLQVRMDAIDRTQNMLGQLSVSFAAAINAVHQTGVDAEGNPGQPLFAMGTPAAIANRLNTSAVTATAAFDLDAMDKLKPADYTVRFNALGEPEVTRKDNGQQLVNGDDFDWDAGSNTLAVGGINVTFSGPPQNNDRFELQPVRRAAGELTNLISDLGAVVTSMPDGGSGDNRVALAMQRLQDERTVGGEATFNQAYAALSSDIGNKTNVVNANMQARQGLTDQLRAVQQSQSGVNLDEEAANLLKFQQFYAANARVIDTASNLFDTILGLRN